MNADADADADANADANADMLMPSFPNGQKIPSSVLLMRQYLKC